MYVHANYNGVDNADTHTFDAHMTMPVLAYLAVAPQQPWPQGVGNAVTCYVDAQQMMYLQSFNI